jgi:hypothetical protein
METLIKPRHLRICLILMVVTLVYEQIIFLVFQLPAIDAHYNININGSAFYAKVLLLMVIFIIIYSFLIYKIHKARAWARIVWSLLFFLNFLGVFLRATFFYDPVTLAPLSAIMSISGIIIMVLLWHPATTHWFKAMKMARLNTSEPMAAETLEIPDNASDKLQNLSDSTIIAEGGNIDNGITSNRPLEILRIIRSIYVLVITFILMNIVAFYILAVNISGSPSTSQNAATLINADRSVSLARLVIFLISIGYVIIEYLFDKRLQSYPQDTINRNYSKKTTLFLSSLFLIFFFYLNILIVYHFIVIKSIIYNFTNLILLYLIVIYVVYKLLIKSEDEKTRRNFWIIAVILSLLIIISNGFIEILFFHYGMPLFSRSVLFIINGIKSITGMLH